MSLTERIHCNEAVSQMSMFLYGTNIIYFQCISCGSFEVLCPICEEQIKNKSTYMVVDHIFEYHFKLGGGGGNRGSNYITNKNGGVISLLTWQLFELIPYLLWLRPATSYPLMLNHLFCNNIVFVGGNRTTETGNELLELLKNNIWICMFCEMEFDSLPDYLLYKNHMAKCRPI